MTRRLQNQIAASFGHGSLHTRLPPKGCMLQNRQPAPCAAPY